MALDPPPPPYALNMINLYDKHELVSRHTKFQASALQTFAVVFDDLIY